MMLDIHGERLKIMTEHNVEFFVLSLASPGPQGRFDKEDAEVSTPETFQRLFISRWLMLKPDDDLGFGSPS